MSDIGASVISVGDAVVVTAGGIIAGAVGGEGICGSVVGAAEIGVGAAGWPATAVG